MLAGLSLSEKERTFSDRYVSERDQCVNAFNAWSEWEQIDFVESLLSKMCHHQHGAVNQFLRPMLQRDFITLLPEKGLSRLAEQILSYLDAKSLSRAGRVCKCWKGIIADGFLWKKLIEREVYTDTLWRGLAKKRGWIDFIFKPRTLEHVKPHDFYQVLYPQIIEDIENIEQNWKCGRFVLHRINCHSENSKGVYCLQYDDQKIISGLRDNTIKIWDRDTLSCRKVMTGHTGSVLCLQYDERVIISGSSDSTVRVWDVDTGDLLNTLIHHCEAVLHLR